MQDDKTEQERRLETAQTTRERIDILNDLAWQEGFNNAAHSIELSEEARRLSTTGEFAAAPYLAGLAKSLLSLSRANTEIGRYAESLNFLLEAQPLFEGLDDQVGIMQVLNEFGRIYYYLGDFSTAIEYYLREAALAQKTGDAEREATVVYNIGLIHLYSDNTKMALDDLSRAMRMAEELDNQRLLAYALEGMAEVYTKTGEIERALDYARQSLEISQPQGFYGLVNNTLLTIGDNYVALGDLEQAEKCYQEALEAGESSGSRHDNAYALAAIGKLMFKRGNTDSALEWLGRALAQADEIGACDLIFDCHQALAEVYKSLHDYEKALEHYEQFHTIEKAMFNEKSDMKLKTLEVLHQVETARRESEIYQLRNTLLQQEIEEHKKVQAMLEELVKIEPLTGLFNRRHFFELAEKEFERARRYQHTFSVIMADIDHFKEINDRFGHAVGDQALVTVATLIRRNLRAADLACRYGGEEFAFLLPETSGPQARSLAERIRSEIAAYSFQVNGARFQLSISIGVAECPGNCVTLDQLFSLADQAMYQAKHLGRNRTYLWMAQDQ